MDEKFTFFWNGPFSQWYLSTFKIGTIQFNCAEQFMMVSKALLFDDNETLNKIMSTFSPKEQKALGRKVKNFDNERWNKVAKQQVYIGNYAKFTQNEDLLQKLLDTKGTTLVEASPYDKIWGIGLREDDERAKSRDTWLGTNWLGEVLTKVRDDIIEKGY